MEPGIIDIVAHGVLPYAPIFTRRPCQPVGVSGSFLYGDSGSPASIAGDLGRKWQSMAQSAAWPAFEKITYVTLFLPVVVCGPRSSTEVTKHGSFVVTPCPKLNVPPKSFVLAA